ncbi:EAL domain-containing protein [Aquabacterium sp. A08]|uniref:bifunctional diguanylate cyclase/phosphodiesterase n=1 Tax=Aquabacterium sp. A08 TaxID=2718532 RepID=UPI00141EF7C0|nr:EAL domain-containing protein [Aquabacterium sp. A08]NIC42992.1 EAL domain-containing protein [Aquabacterium sp. A08]
MVLPIRPLLLNLLTALAYAGSGWASLQASIPPHYIAIIFVASGIALGAVLTGGARLLPGVALGALGVQLLAHSQSGALGWTWTLVVTPLGAALMAWATAWAVRRWVGYPSALDRPQQAVLMCFAIIPAGTAINASLSVPFLVLDGVVPPGEALFSWWTWWLADTLGAVLFTPLVLVLFGQPADAWRPRLRTVALPMLVALALVAGMLQLLNANQQRNLDEQFAKAGQDLALRLQRRFDAQIDSVEAIAKLMELTPQMDQATFESATRLWLQRYPGTQNYGWSPHVTDAQRWQYEQVVPGINILGRDALGQTSLAPRAASYLPITWVVPLTTNLAVRGLDVSVLPATGATVRATLASGRPEVTEGLRLVQESGEQRAVVAYLRVRQPDGEPKGVVSAVFRMDDVLGAVLGTFAPNSLTLCLVDNQAATHNRRLSGPAGCDVDAAQRAHRDRWREGWPLRFAARDWTLYVQADAGFWASHALHSTWISTAAGLIAVSMLGTFLIVITGQGRRTAQLVLERTHELAHSNASLMQLAHFDALTGLANRTFWTEQAQATLAAAQQNGKHVAVLFLDLDRFKHVNDSLGHTQGDELLVTVSARIQACLRARDVLARLGGDEFVALLPWVRGRDGAATVARKVAQALSEPIVLDRMQVTVTASVGVALYPDHGESVDALLRHADTAMYAAKAAGRNQWRFFEPAMHAHVSRRLALESALRLALETGSPELYVAYQPQVNAAGRVVGLEALLRWQHPELGAVSPQEFITVAEESGVIESLGHWLLTQVCRQIQAWADGPAAQDFAGLTVAVNVSALEFGRPHFLDHLRDALAQMQQPAGRLELEITESLLVHAGPELNERMRELTDLGIGLSLDDFGTGYSSLGYLKRLPLSKLKIDRSFVQGIPSDPEDEAIIRATLSMAHDLGLVVVAEGVETVAQRDFLLAHGCDMLQGWLYARALTPPALEAWLQQQG